MVTLCKTLQTADSSVHGLVKVGGFQELDLRRGRGIRFLTNAFNSSATEARVRGLNSAGLARGEVRVLFLRQLLVEA